MKKIILALLSFVLLFGSPFAFSAERQKFYSVDTNKEWGTNNIPNGEIFTCTACKDLVQIQISYSPEFPANSPYKNNSDFINTIKNRRFSKKIC